MDITTTKFIVTIVATAAVVMVCSAWYYEHQLKIQENRHTESVKTIGHIISHDVDLVASARLFVERLAMYGGNPRNWDSATRMEFRQLVLWCEAVLRNEADHPEHCEFYTVR